MQFPTLTSYLNWAKGHAPKGPFAFIFAQDDIELTHTVAHHIKLGFPQTVVLADPPLARPADLPAETAFVRRAAKSSVDISQEMNAIISARPGNGFIAAIMANIFLPILRIPQHRRNHRLHHRRAPHDDPNHRGRSLCGKFAAKPRWGGCHKHLFGSAWVLRTDTASRPKCPARAAGQYLRRLTAAL